MPSDSEDQSAVNRRGFIRGVAVGSPLFAAQVAVAKPQRPVAEQAGGGEKAPATAESSRAGADFMVDVIKSLGIEYCAANPGSSILGLHESIINYGQNSNPELLTCCHEESSAAMAHGYAKIEGKPMMILVHGTVGLQHASMAIYNCYADRVPLYVLLGNISNINYRRSINEWAHSAQDPAAMVRDFVKWDDAPVNLAHFAESAVRAYKIAMTPPLEPVVVVADAELQEQPVSEQGLRVPHLAIPAPPQGDLSAVREAARLLCAAENPVIVAGRTARTPHGIELLVELAELLQARVIDQRMRMNFPSNHPLYSAGSGSVSDADVILGLEARDLWSLTHRMTPRNRRGTQIRSALKPGARVITVSALDLNHKANFQDFGHYIEADLAIAGDAEATLPLLIDEVGRLITPDQARALQERGGLLAAANRRAREQDRVEAAVAWDASPITTARLSAELWSQVRNEDWSLVSGDFFVSNWPTRLWDFTRFYQYIGGQGAGGEGYYAPAACGAALANRKHGRLSIAIEGDGDLNYAPGVLWTAAHHRIPLLMIVHNNRAYHEERMRVQMVCNLNNRGVERANIGTALTDPDISYSSIAKGYGMYSEGPISDPGALGPAIRRGIERVKKGEPALLDVLTQPR